MSESFHTDHMDWSADEQSVTIKEEYGWPVEKNIPYSDIKEVEYFPPTSSWDPQGFISIHTFSSFTCETLDFASKDARRAKEVFRCIDRYVGRNSKQKGGKSRARSRRNTICMSIIIIVVLVIIAVAIPTGSSSSSKQSQKETYNDMGYYKGSDGKWYHYWSSYD